MCVRKRDDCTLARAGDAMDDDYDDDDVEEEEEEEEDNHTEPQRTAMATGNDDDDDDYDVDVEDEEDEEDYDMDEGGEDDDDDDEFTPTRGGKRRGTKANTSTASGSRKAQSMVVPKVSVAAQTPSVKVASIAAEEALRQLQDRTLDVPETGEILKFTSLLYDGQSRSYAASMASKRMDDGGARARAKAREDEEDEDETSASESGTDDDTNEIEEATWFSKVDTNVPVTRYRELAPELSEDEDLDYDADEEVGTFDAGEQEALMVPPRGTSGIEHAEWERAVIWGADSDEDEELRLAAVGIDVVGAFKKPRREEQDDDSLATASAVAPRPSGRWGEARDDASSSGTATAVTAGAEENDDLADHMRYLKLFRPPEASERDQGGDAEMRDAEARPSGAGALLRHRNYELASGRWLDDVAWEGQPAQVIDPHRKYILPKVMVNPNDPRIVLQFKGDLEATVWKWANATVVPSWDLDPVEDVDAAFNISIDDKYKEEVLEKVEGGERPPRQGRIDGIQHAEFLLSSVPQLVFDPINDYPSPKPVLQPPTILPKQSAKVRLAGTSDDTFKVCIKSLNLHSSVINLKVRPTDTVGSLIPRIRKRWSDLEGPIHLYFPGSPKPAEKLEENMTLTNAGLQAQVGLPIVYLVAPKITFIPEEDALAPLASDAVLAPPGAYKKPSDLTAKQGTLMMVQYTEARPLFFAKPGMGAKKVVYYRRKTLGDQGARPYSNASTTVFDLKPNAPSPFLGELPPGVGVTALETSMFRSPLFQQPKSDEYQDFLLIRGPNGKFTMREAPPLFLAGQQEPHMEVPTPGSSELKDFEERLVNATVLRYFLDLQARGAVEPGVSPVVKASDVAATLAHVMSVRDVRKKIRPKICAPRRGVNANEDEFILNPSYRFEHEKEVQRMATPEEICAYESYRNAVAMLCRDRTAEEKQRILRLSSLTLQQLTNAVTVLVRHSEGKRKRALENLELWLQIQPWAQTYEFGQAAQGNKGILHLETSRRLQRLTGKFYNYIRRMTKPDPPEDRRPRREPGTVTGTNADLRKLTMPQSQRILENFGVEREVILRLERWKRIGLIRELSGAATADGQQQHAGMARFARRLRVSEAQQLVEVRENSNLLFKRQFKQYAQRRIRHEDSSSGGETDDDDDDDDDDESSSESESDSLANELEAQLTSVKDPDAGPTEEDERAELEALRSALKDGASIEPSIDPMKALAQGILVPGKKLKLTRVTTHIFPDGRSAKVEDDITEYAGHAWLGARAQGAEAADAATTQALLECGMDKPPPPPKEALEKKELDPEETGITPEAKARYEMLRQRKRAKERVRRAGEKIKRLQALGVTDEGADPSKVAPTPKLTIRAPVAGAPPAGGLKIKLGNQSKKVMQRVLGSTGGEGEGAATTPAKKSSARKIPWDKALIRITEAAMKHATYGAVFSTPVTLDDYSQFVQKPMDLSAIMNRLREGLYDSPHDWARDMTLIAKNAKTYHMNEAPVALRLDWVPGMAADLLNWCAETTKRYERDIQVNYSDFTHEHLVVAHPGPGSGSAAPVEAPAAAPTPPAAAPKTLPKLKFSLKKPAP